MSNETVQREDITEIVRITVKETLGYRDRVLNEEFDVRYKNVKLLMRNYRKLKLYCEKVSAEVLEVDAIYLMQRKTILMISHIDKMLVAYKALCQQSKLPEQHRRWEALYLRYIDERKMSIDQIAEHLHIDRRIFYRDISNAMDELAVLLFGIESIGTCKHKKKSQKETIERDRQKLD